jgi:hypothetical protein
MDIHETNGRRFDVAMAQFREGNTVRYAKVTFQLLAPNTLLRRVESSWQPERITAARALQDLDSADDATKYLQSESAVFSNLIEGREYETVLFVDYRMGGVGICTRTPSGIAWEKGYPVDKNI